MGQNHEDKTITKRKEDLLSFERRNFIVYHYLLEDLVYFATLTIRLEVA